MWGPRRLLCCWVLALWYGSGAWAEGPKLLRVTDGTKSPSDSPESAQCAAGPCLGGTRISGEIALGQI